MHIYVHAVIAVLNLEIDASFDCNWSQRIELNNFHRINLKLTAKCSLSSTRHKM